MEKPQLFHMWVDLKSVSMTLRQRIMAELEKGPMTARDISKFVRISEKEVIAYTGATTHNNASTKHIQTTGNITWRISLSKLTLFTELPLIRRKSNLWRYPYHPG